MTSAGSDSLTEKSSDSSVTEEHPIKEEYRKWAVWSTASIYRSPAQDTSKPQSIGKIHAFRLSKICNAAQDAIQKAYEAEVDNAMKDIIKEYDKWRAENASKLWKWFKSCGEDEEPDF
ncbi:hypothetical protein EDD18DRAFT_1113484 [Armillaria luteobubalina]|uniref:Uncharacterized protein n=1 Tax=Armillaria luteobubalina TaxID=153913 RepID=A0AA39PAL4_9AGAR|nr:hypothetical protein EDD18DRAFT_1113484 [Armillaria luteobubalina]